MLVESINVGQVTHLSMQGESVLTGIFKQPVAGPIEVGELGLVGDVQADHRFHGGPDKALNVYPVEHYAYWREVLGQDWSAGAFGENFTTRGLLEDEIAIGDVFQMGDARFEVTQARQPCWKLAAKHHLPGLVKLVETSGRTGFYLRCLTPGTISAGMELNRISRPEPLFSVRAAYQILRDRHDLEQAQELLRVSALSDAWRAEMLERFEA
jgi:MOSC domain-containing protein YiiM